MIDNNQPPKSKELCCKFANALWETWIEELNKLQELIPVQECFNIEYNAYVFLGIAFFKSWEKMEIPNNVLHDLTHQIPKFIYNELCQEKNEFKKMDSTGE